MKITNMIVTKEKDNNLMGHMFWFSIGNILIHEGDLEEKLEVSGLGSSFMPNPIRVSDAFRRATTEVKRRRDTEMDKVYQKLLIAEVVASKEMIVRNVVIETINQTNKELSYETGKGEIRLHKENGTFKYHSNDEEITSIIKEVESRFHLYKTHYGSPALRALIPKVMDQLAVVPMRKNGGIYFIPEGKTKELNALVEFINSLDDSEAYKIPVHVSDESEQMLVKQLDYHISQLLEQCRDVSGLRKGQMKALVEEADMVVHDFEEYSNLTGDQFDYLYGKVSLLKDEVLRVITKMG